MISIMNFVPSEYAWIIPLIVPFLIGLISGIIVKRTLKLIFAIIGLFLILVAIGYSQLPSVEACIRDALTYLPLIQEKAGPLINIIPYSSASFLIGLALGLWKG